MGFDVDTGRLRRIAASCEQQADHYENRRRTLAQRCESLQGTCSGVSAQGFQNISSQWISSTQHTVNELRDIARKLRDLAEHYDRIDREERARKKRKKDD